MSKNHTVTLEFPVPKEMSDRQLETFVQGVVAKADALHKQYGGSGVKLVDVEVVDEP